MTNPSVAEVEARAGRGKPLPGYVEDVLLARWLGIPPDRVPELPVYWYKAAQIVLIAQHRAQEAKHGKQGQ